MKKALVFAICTLFSVTSEAQWIPTNGPPNYVSTFAISDSNIFAGTIEGFQQGGVYLTTDNGQIWTETSLRNKSVYSLVISGTKIFAGTSDNIYLSTDKGQLWSPTSFNNLAQHLIISGSNIFAGVDFAQYSGIYRSTDNGQTWTQTSLQEGILSLIVDGPNIFAGTYDVNRSTDNGQTWVKIYHGYEELFSLAANGSNIFAGTYHKILSTTNGGLTWSYTNFNCSVFSCTTIRSSNIFAGSLGGNCGLYLSANNGLNWTLRNEGLIDSNINSVVLTDEFIFVGTQSNHVWKRPLNELIGINKISNEVSQSFSLLQNYPNPFNPTTKIKFGIAELRGQKSEVRLIIYDILGREVTTLVNEKLLPGTYEVEWDGSKYVSGVYFYRLSATEFTETRKMVLVK